jgi:lambda family phage portal protein
MTPAEPKRKGTPFDAGVLFDRLIGVVAPQFAHKRLVARARTRLLLQSVFHDAARRTRGESDWTAKGGSADLSILPEAPTILARARDAVMNTPWARAARGAFGNNVVGPRGIMPFAAVKKPDGELDDDLNEKIDEAWDRWADDRLLCDIEQRCSLIDTQRQAVEQTVEAGEFFVLMTTTPSREFPLRLQRFETEQLETAHILNPKSKHEIRGGIEINEVGAAVAYHLRRTQRDVGLRAFSPLDPIIVPARNMLHLFKQDRPLQTRGVSELIAVLKKIRDLDIYDEWALEAAKIQACASLIFTSEYADLAQTLAGTSTATGAVSVPGDLPDPDQPQNLFEPGMIVRGKPGEHVDTIRPSYPADGYDKYVNAQAGNIGAGIGVSGQAITHEPKGNYSGARQTMIEDHNTYGCRGTHVRQHLMMPIRRRWLATTILRGTIKVPGFAMDIERFMRTDWIMPAKPWIDPLKESAAWISLNKHGHMSAQEIAAMRGQHWRRVRKQMVIEQKFNNDAELRLASSFSVTTPDDDDGPTGTAGNGRAAQYGIAVS